MAWIAPYKSQPRMRRQCIVEHREKFEWHCIASKLISTQGGNCRVNKNGGKFLEINEAEKVVRKRMSSEKESAIGDNVQLINAGNNPNVHCCKGKPTLIAGDSMLSCLDERHLSNKGNVNICAFPSSIIVDLQEH